MKVNDFPTFQIYERMSQSYCCELLAQAVTIQGMYHIAYRYEDANGGGKYVLMLTKKNPNLRTSIFNFCPYCGKKIDENR
mgnify:CR=1 FL=1